MSFKSFVSASWTLFFLARIGLKKLFLAFFIIATSSVSAQFNYSSGSQTKNNYKILLDAGHGGSDYGCNGNYVYEKDINLAITLKVGELINSHLPNTEVLYTRKDDITLDLCSRAVAANSVEADLFISIHCNAGNRPSARGFEIFIQNVNLTQEEIAAAKLEAEFSEFEEVESDDCPSNDLSSKKMILAATLAIKINTNMVNVGFDTRGVKKANFMVLRKTQMPSILIECGFLTNSDEEQFLASEEGQTIVAASIVKGIIDIYK